VVNPVPTRRGSLEQFPAQRRTTKFGFVHPATAFVHGSIGESVVLAVEIDRGEVRFHGQPLNISALNAAQGPSKLFARRHDVLIGPAGGGPLQGAIRHVRSFGPIQRLEVALSDDEKDVIEIDAPRGPIPSNRRYRRPRIPPV
jgi:ABC-type sulfate/molybdate transport systems ATPase subunit